LRETQRKGDIAKAQAISSFTRLGYDVGVLITESAAYDLVVDDGEVRRVQVKYCGDKNGWLDLRTIHSNATGYVVKKTQSKVYDWLYVLGSDGVEYLLKDCLVGRRSVSLKTLPILDHTADAEANRLENDGS
jgi:hypothetical protein